MSYSVVIQPQAEQDVREAVLWMSQWTPDKATDWGFDVIKAIRSLSRFPARCPFAPERVTYGLDIRHLLFDRYRILFIIEDETVYVLRVRHQAQAALEPDDEA